MWNSNRYTADDDHDEEDSYGNADDEDDGASIGFDNELMF